MALETRFPRNVDMPDWALPGAEMKRIALSRWPVKSRAHVFWSQENARAPAGTRTDMERRADEVSELLRTLANRNRLMIACALVEAEYAVGGLEEELGIHQPTLSQQLTVLRAAGIVETRREAKQIFYRLTDDRVSCLLEALYLIFCRDDDGGARKDVGRAISRARK